MRGRDQISLHARAMYKMTRDGEPEEHGSIGPMAQIEAMRNHDLPVAFVGDVVGTGSSRKSTNSVLWFFGEDIPGVQTNDPAASVSATRSHLFSLHYGRCGALVFEAPVEKPSATLLRYDPTGKILNEAGDVSEFEHKSDAFSTRFRPTGH